MIVDVTLGITYRIEDAVDQEDAIRKAVEEESMRKVEILSVEEVCPLFKDEPA